MRLISADGYEVKIGVSLKEFDLLKDMVEDRAERDHAMLLEHPEILYGFREGRKQLILLWQEGAMDVHEP